MADRDLSSQGTRSNAGEDVQTRQVYHGGPSIGQTDHPFFAGFSRGNHRYSQTTLRYSQARALVFASRPRAPSARPLKGGAMWGGEGACASSGHGQRKRSRMIVVGKIRRATSAEKQCAVASTRRFAALTFRFHVDASLVDPRRVSALGPMRVFIFEPPDEHARHVARKRGNRATLVAMT